MTDADIKHCPICNNDLPISEFGICRARRDGRNLYCKSCIRHKVTQSRRSLKEYKASRKRALQLIEEGEIQKVERKPMVLAPFPKTVKEKVYEAIEAGHQTRPAIKAETRLPWDPLTDALAMLRDEGSIEIKRVEGEACFFVIKGEKRIQRVA